MIQLIHELIALSSKDIAVDDITSRLGPIAHDHALERSPARRSSFTARSRPSLRSFIARASSLVRALEGSFERAHGVS